LTAPIKIEIQTSILLENSSARVKLVSASSEAIKKNFQKKIYFGHLYTIAFQHIKNKGNQFSELKVIGPLLAGLPLKTPANFYICEHSQSGKSYLVRSMLRHAEELFNPVPTKIIDCYGICQKEFEEMLQSMRNLTLVEGFPDNLCEMTRGHDNSLVVLDDLMSQCSNDPRVSDLFTRDSHHLGMSVLYLTQNLLPPGERSRTIV
jgi:hypothetical protein